MRILWTDGAERNLESIESYIALDNPRAAARVVLKLIRRVQRQLSQYPASGKTGRLAGTRELIFPDLPYIVIYAVKGEVVIILRVFHAAQKLDAD